MPSDTFSPYANAISGIESGGNYAAMGPETKSGDRAHGKYQIMGANIGPWSKEVLGQEITPEQFLANPQIQDAIFQGKFQQYVDKYGPEGAAKAWFAGERGMNNPNAKDSLGTTVSGYGAGRTSVKGRTIDGELVAKSVADKPSAFSVGDRVFHQKFGNGNISSIEGNKLTIDFDKAGQKRVLDGFVAAV